MLARRLEYCLRVLHRRQRPIDVCWMYLPRPTSLGTFDDSHTSAFLQFTLPPRKGGHVAAANRFHFSQPKRALQLQNATDAGTAELGHAPREFFVDRIGQRQLSSNTAARLNAKRSIAVGGIPRETLLTDMLEYTP
jgi:hypothetical protein